jgi:hypothetical protein
MTFKEILNRKIKYYGKTEAAYEFAAKEYSNKLIKEAQAEQLILSGVSNWVAISDRKPPKEWSNYMVCLENNSIFQANYCRIGTERWLIVGVGEITNENPVLYWMEEPKPPCC